MSSNQENVLLDAMGHFLGYGKMNATYSFFGIEEREVESSPERDNVFIEKYSDLRDSTPNEYFYTLNEQDFQSFYEIHPSERDYDIFESRKTRIYSAERFIVNSMEGRETVADNFSLWNHDILMGNLSPIPRLNINIPRPADGQEWIMAHGEERNIRIIDYIAQLDRTHYTFCFGATNFEIWKTLFGWRDITFERQDFEPPVRSFYYRSVGRPIFLLYHPSHGGLTRNQIDYICRSVI
jgi:hypothetical protein